MKLHRFPLMVKLRLLKGCITRTKADAIITSSNSMLAHNAQSGYWRFTGRENTNGAVHKAGGAALREACQRIPTDDNGIRCPPGSAIWTPATGLLVEMTKHVIHCCAPDGLYGSTPEQQLLEQTYASCLRVARELGARSVALPAIGCGVQGWPAATAFRAAIGAVATDAKGLESLDFILLNDHIYNVWIRMTNDKLVDHEDYWRLPDG